MQIKMREEFLRRKEEIATAGAVDISPEGVNKQLEATHDMMIDIHKTFVEESANEMYTDFYNRLHDDTYVPLHKGKVFASLSVPHEGLSIFSTVEIVSIFPTGIVEFLDPRDKKTRRRLFSDELMNYRDKRLNAADKRDVVT